MGSEDSQGFDPSLERFRERLKILAAALIPRKLQARFDSSDVVQDTLLKAQQHLPQFRGDSDGQFFAWLQELLRTQCIDNIRHHTADKRDQSVEISMQETINQSFARLEQLLAADTTSPSDGVKRSEMILKSLDTLSTLPAKERDVIMAYYLHGLKQQEIAESLGMSKSDVARTIQKGLAQLRREFKGEIGD